MVICSVEMYRRSTDGLSASDLTEFQSTCLNMASESFAEMFWQRRDGISPAAGLQQTTCGASDSSISRVYFSVTSQKENPCADLLLFCCYCFHASPSHKPRQKSRFQWMPPMF